jgi:hypothetical protein
MKFYGMAEESAKVILEAFRNPNCLPKPLADDADLGGCWEYIWRYAEKAGLEVIDACGKVLQRTCEAVAVILDTAEALREREEAVA